jgi:hypothetical protein
MKVGLLWIVAGLAVDGSLLGAEVMESLKTRDGREYLKVEIIEHDDIGLKIRHDAGTARIPFERLPDDLRDKYHFDPEKAAAQKAMENKAQNQHDRIQAAAVAPATTKAAAAPAATESGTDTEFAPAADDLELEKLEAYIVSMKLKVETAHKKSADLKVLAATERARKRMVNKGTDRRGNPQSEMVDDKVGWAKAKKYEAEASAIDQQVAKARVMIGTAEAKYSRLSGTEAPMAPSALPDLPPVHIEPIFPGSRKR